MFASWLHQQLKWLLGGGTVPAQNLPASINTEAKLAIETKLQEWRANKQALPWFTNLHPELTALLVVNESTRQFLEQLAPPPPSSSLAEIPAQALQVLSGMTPTVSTVPNAFIPNRAELLASFCALRPHSALSEGGRAFTKHCHRHEAFWGSAKGSAQHINATALERLEYILDHATWKNLFCLPGDLPVCEFRIESGYGARWTVQQQKEDEGGIWHPTLFRGFLEPPQADGHAVGWKH